MPDPATRAPGPSPRGAFAFLNSRLTLSARLLALCLVFCLPIALLTGLFVAQSWKDISFAKREAAGAAYERAIWPVLRLSALRADAGQDTVDLRAVRAPYDARFQSTAASRALVSASGSPARLAAAQALMELVADRSNLTLDPDLDSFYVMDAVTVRLPTLLGSLNALSQAAALPVAAPDRAVRITDALDAVRGASDAAGADLATAIRANAPGATRKALADHAADLARLTKAVTAHRDHLFAGAPPSSLDLDSRALQSEADATWRAAQTELQRLLAARIDRLNEMLVLNLSLVLYFIALAVALALAIAGALTERVTGLLAAMDRLVAGDTAAEAPYLADRNEAGRIAGAVEAFRLSLIEAARLRQEAAAQAADAQAARAAAEAERERVVRFLSVGELASSIAHEINQPIAAVVAGGAAAGRWLEHQPPNLGRARTAIGRIVRDATRASEVIQRIRQVLGKAAPALAEVDVNAIAAEAMQFTERERSLAGAATRLDLAPALPMARGDVVQLQQVIINLTLNGLDAMKSVADRPRSLVLATQLTAAGEVMVSVSDNGEGLAPDIAEHLFDPFYTTKQTGMGLGLSISRSIIDQHGGRIWAEAAEGGGAVFRFTLQAWPAS